MPSTSFINCTHILEMFKVKNAFANLIKLDKSTEVTTSEIGGIWKARCQFHDLVCTQEDASESVAKEKVAERIIHELVLRRDPLLCRLPTCFGIMNLPREEYIEALIWDIYEDLGKVQIAERHTASACAVGSEFKHAKSEYKNLCFVK